MLVTFNPGKNELLTIEFDTRVSWDKYLDQCKERGQLVPYNTTPESFPCLMVYDNNILPIDGEHGKYYNFFIYHYANS